MSQVRARNQTPLISTPACLVVVYAGLGAPEQGQRIELGAEQLIVGRGQDADIQIDRDSVSRRHARLYRAGGIWRICDLQSTNGTYVGDQPVDDTPIADGARLQIGGVIFRFLSGPVLIAAYLEEIHRGVVVDGLTEVASRRKVLEALAGEVARAGRWQRPLSLALFDVDLLRGINDSHGPLAGDHVLRGVAGRLRGQLQSEELLGRHGPDEFLLVMPEVDREGALQRADALRRTIEAETFDFTDERIQVTVSAGVASLVQGFDAAGQGPAPLLKAAEECLTRAKRGGRNRAAG